MKRRSRPRVRQPARHPVRLLHLRIPGLHQL